MLMKKWDINDSKKIRKKFEQKNTASNKHVLDGIWHVIFYKTSWSAIIFQKLENYKIMHTKSFKSLGNPRSWFY